MSKLLLNLRHVPDDEADDVRAMLADNRIEFYVTKPSIWGISGGGIFVTDDLVFVVERDNHRRVRAEYEAARQAGTAETFWTVLRDDPARVALVLVGIAFLLALVALPVVLLRG